MFTSISKLHFSIKLWNSILEVNDCALKRNFRSLRRLRFGNYQMIMDTGKVSAPNAVPEYITRPPYNENVLPPPGPSAPEIKSPEQIEKMKKSCALARKVLDFSKTILKIGTTTNEIDSQVHAYIIDHGAYPSPLFYRNFPKSICTSINNVICHGIPDDRPLQDGDIINIDITVYFDGYHGDCSETFIIGNVDEAGHHLVDITRRCLEEGIKMCEPGQYFHRIGAAIENFATRNGLNVVPNFIGHGIGQYFHGPPDIHHFYNRLPGRMQAGMTFTIEPALSQGSRKYLLLDDGWTAVTSDGSRSAQFEHTVLITDEGVEILTA